MPGNIPATIPDELPAAATVVLALDHTPPPTEARRVVVPPTHAVVAPVTIAAGFTVKVIMAGQPDGAV